MFDTVLYSQRGRTTYLRILYYGSHAAAATHRNILIKLLPQCRLEEVQSSLRFFRNLYYICPTRMNNEILIKRYSHWVLPTSRYTSRQNSHSQNRNSQKCNSRSSSCLFLFFAPSGCNCIYDANRLCHALCRLSSTEKCQEYVRMRMNGYVSNFLHYF